MLSMQPMLPLTVPAGTVIDTGHLSQMTLGDRSLEREVLQLFDRQAAMLMGRMRDSLVLAEVSACAHTLKGSARGIGAWAVASAAEAVELAAGSGHLADPHLSDLAASIGDARKAIAGLLQPH
jgi:HPt (histidine-containing phosphotransfer) domain-containing protein